MKTGDGGAPSRVLAKNGGGDPSFPLALYPPVHRQSRFSNRPSPSPLSLPPSKWEGYRACPREDGGGDPSFPFALYPPVHRRAGSRTALPPPRFPFPLPGGRLEPVLEPPFPLDLLSLPAPGGKVRACPREDGGRDPSLPLALYPPVHRRGKVREPPFPLQGERLEPALVKTGAGIHLSPSHSTLLTVGARFANRPSPSPPSLPAPGGKVRACPREDGGRDPSLPLALYPPVHRRGKVLANRPSPSRGKG